MLSFNPSILASVIADATQAAAAHPRWVTAIARAGVELERNPWIAVNGSHLLIGSDSGHCYDVNGSCQCMSFLNGQACWHRAARQLVARYIESEAREVAPARAYTCKGCGERTEERGLCYACVTRGPKVEPTYSNRVQRQIAAARATALMNECFS